MLLFGAAGAAAALAPTVVRQTAEGPIVRFVGADFAQSGDARAPATGWREAPAGLTISRSRLDRQGGERALWTRMDFERSVLGPEPLAIYTEDNRNRFQLFLNGAEIHRDFAAPRDPLVTAYEPVLIPIPPGLLHPGRNDITAAIFSRYDLGAGTFEIGPQRAMSERFGWMNLWRIDVPRKVNFAMLMLAYGSLVYWVFNRGEIQFALMGATAFLWCLSNSSFLFETSPLGEVSLSAHPTVFLYLAGAATLAFAVEFVGFGRWRSIGAVTLSSGAALALLYGFASERWIADGAAQLFAVVLIALGVGVSGQAWRRSRADEDLGLAVILAAIALGILHDFGRAWYVHVWNGLGLFVRPYAGFVLVSGFLFSFGRRSAAAFLQLRLANADLLARVAEARAEIAVSEDRRRELEVASAMEAERERLLREMHDGIGSNLVTALAIAEQQKQPAAVLHTLRRALSDLKITIDSLEPVEGDLVALLANLRHRMERDLRDAGLVCRWRVADCRPLPWLDATNALHVLRIFQEAIGNVLAHAGATTLEIGCHEETRDGDDGLRAYVSDDGHGFDMAGPAGGKGVGNMRSRARALHGHFECVSDPSGTRVAIWLPYDRGEGAAG